MSQPLQEPSLLHDDNWLYVAYKPSGMHTIQQQEKDRSLQQWLEETHAVEPLQDAGLVQRLDYYTSGCLLGAKTDHILSILRTLIKQEEVQKSYYALVEGIWIGERTFRSWIGSPYRRSKKVKISEQLKKPKRFLEGTSHISASRSCQKLDISLVEVCAPKARRHQVRAHLAHLGHPLLGDELYGAARSLGDVGLPRGGFFLLAASLSLMHPKEHQELSVTVPLPEFIERLFDTD